jgi:hypothetical protein
MNPKVILCAALLLASTSEAQRIQLATSAAVLDQATISDLDFVRSTTPKWLFTIELRVDPPLESVSNIVVDVNGDLSLADGRSQTDVVTLTTLPFSVNGSLSLTNLDLARSGIRGDYCFYDSKIEQLGIKGVALSGTRLPAGTYTLRLGVHIRGSFTELARGKIVFVLTNPSAVELLSPIDGDAAGGQFPLFQWLYDGAESRISVFEKLPGNSSLEDAVTGVPHLVQDVPANSFQYPTAGARVLQPGKSYVWFVEGLVRSAGGIVQTIRSQLRSFTVVPSGMAAQAESLLDILERALGPKYSALFEQLRRDEFSTPGLLMLDGTPITPQSLRTLIDQIQQNPDVVHSVRVE